MPILSYSPTSDILIQPNLPKIEPDGYKSLVYDDDNVPTHSLLSYVEGSSWTVNYYSQIISEHNDLREIDVGQSEVYQQYTSILGLELRLTNQLSSQYDSSTAISSASGTATMYPFLVPNVSDYWVSNTFDNQDAIYKVTNVERTTFNRDSLYSVEFILVGYASQFPDVVQDLKNKTNRTYHFYKDRLTNGLYPFVTTKQSDFIKSLHKTRMDLISYYFKNFFNRRYYTFLIPGQSKSVYDGYLVKFLLSILNSDDVSEYSLIKELPDDYNSIMNSKTIFDIVIERNPDELNIISNKMMAIKSTKLLSPAYVHGLGYVPTDYLIYPVNPDISSMVESMPVAISQSEYDIVQTNNYTNSSFDYNTVNYVVNNVTYVVTSAIDFNSSYVFSQSFYSSTPSMSLLEILVKDYIRKQSLNTEFLNHILKSIKNWNRLEQYYHIPILILLVTNVKNEIYKG